VSGARLLVAALRDPTVAVRDWTALISAARAEQLIGSLAFRMEARTLPPRVAALFAAARADAAQARTQALWEAEMARRALAPLGVPVILLKGTAFTPPIWTRASAAASAISTSWCRAPAWRRSKPLCSAPAGSM